MQLVLPDGRTLCGPDAVPEILRRIRGCGWLAALDRVPGGRRILVRLVRRQLRPCCGPPAGASV
jgi:hypothetical protein